MNENKLEDMGYKAICRMEKITLNSTISHYKKKPNLF